MKTIFRIWIVALLSLFFTTSNAQNYNNLGQALGQALGQKILGDNAITLKGNLKEET